MHRLTGRIMGLAAVLVFASSCNQRSAPADLDDDTDLFDTETGDDTGTEAETETDMPNSWDGVVIESVSAPDEFTVLVDLSGSPPVDEASSSTIYGFTSDFGSLTVLEAAYDPEDSLVTISTSRQKLGITYTVEIDNGGAEPLNADFISADTAVFWVTDFSSYYYEKFEVTALRELVGEHSVVYCQEGYYAFGAPAASEHFDNEVFPKETAMFVDAPDLDGNGKIVMLGLDGGYDYGGYFDPLNAYTDAEAMSNWGVHSNGMEIIHINISWGDFDIDHNVVTHEFQHLLYQEGHGFSDWTYHNEGMAECAVLVVNGDYPMVVDFYYGDTGDIANGSTSLVDWGYSVYENYAVAFMFWSYIAGQLGGVDHFAELWDLSSGSPPEVDDFLMDYLGLTFGEVQLNQMLATWVKADSGEFSYHDMFTMSPEPPPNISSSVGSVQLKPFAGVSFATAEDQISYPGGQGANIVYAGVNSLGQVDTTEPFEVSDGALVVLNTNFEYSSFPTETSGPYPVPVPNSEDISPNWGDDTFEVPSTWLDPPPYNPYRPEEYNRWRQGLEARRATAGRAVLGW